MTLKTFLVEILVSTLAIKVSGLINEELGPLPGGEIIVYRRGNVERDKCQTYLTFKARTISNMLWYDCVEDPGAVIGESFTIIDGVVYSDTPNVIVILTEGRCEYRNFKDRPIKSKPITDDEYCKKVKEALHDKKSIRMIEKEEEERESHGIFVVFEWSWEFIKNTLESLGLELGGNNDELAIQKAIAPPKPSCTDYVLDAINKPLDYIGEHFWDEKRVDNSKAVPEITAPPTTNERPLNPWDVEWT